MERAMAAATAAADVWDVKALNFKDDQMHELTNHLFKALCICDSQNNAISEVSEKILQGVKTGASMIDLEPLVTSLEQHTKMFEGDLTAARNKILASLSPHQQAKALLAVARVGKKEHLLSLCSTLSLSDDISPENIPRGTLWGLLSNVGLEHGRGMQSWWLERCFSELDLTSQVESAFRAELRGHRAHVKVREGQLMGLLDELEAAVEMSKNDSTNDPETIASLVRNIFSECAAHVASCITTACSLENQMDTLQRCIAVCCARGESKLREQRSFSKTLRVIEQKVSEWKIMKPEAPDLVDAEVHELAQGIHKMEMLNEQYGSKLGSIATRIADGLGLGFPLDLLETECLAPYEELHAKMTTQMSVLRSELADTLPRMSGAALRCQDVVSVMSTVDWFSQFVTFAFGEISTAQSVAPSLWHGAQASTASSMACWWRKQCAKNLALSEEQEHGINTAQDKMSSDIESYKAQVVALCEDLEDLKEEKHIAAQVKKMLEFTELACQSEDLCMATINNSLDAKQRCLALGLSLGRDAKQLAPREPTQTTLTELEPQFDGPLDTNIEEAAAVQNQDSEDSLDTLLTRIEDLCREAHTAKMVLHREMVTLLDGNEKIGMLDMYSKNTQREPMRETPPTDEELWTWPSDLASDLDDAIQRWSQGRPERLGLSDAQILEMKDRLHQMRIIQDEGARDIHERCEAIQEIESPEEVDSEWDKIQELINMVDDELEENREKLMKICTATQRAHIMLALSQDESGGVVPICSTWCLADDLNVESLVPTVWNVSLVGQDTAHGMQIWWRKRCCQELDISEELDRKLDNMLQAEINAQYARAKDIENVLRELENRIATQETLKMEALSSGAVRRWNELDVNLHDKLDGDEVKALAEWVWCSFRAGQEMNELNKEEETAKMMRRCDVNDTGSIDKSEFKLYYNEIATDMFKFHKAHAKRVAVQKS